MSPGAFDLSIVIPAYNEEKRLGPTLERIGKFFSGRDESWEVIVSDDGSSDGTGRIAEDAAKVYPTIRVHRGTHAGKGAAVKRGVFEALGRRVLVCDADSATPIEEYARMRPLIEAGADVVLGSRLLHDAGRPVRRLWVRELSSRLHNRLARAFLLPQGISDAHCGFKLFRSEAAHDIFGKQVLAGFGFDLEILYIAAKQGYRIREVAVAWTSQPGSKVNPFREPFILVGDIFRVKKIHG